MLAKRAAERTCAGLTPTSAAVARETRIIMGELGNYWGYARPSGADFVLRGRHAACGDCQNPGARRSAPQPGSSRTSQALSLFGDDLRVRVRAQTLGGAEASAAGPHPNKTDLRPYRPGSRARRLHQRRRGNSARTWRWRLTSPEVWSVVT